MKILNRSKLVYFLLTMLVLGCQEDEPTLDTVVVPTNIALNATVANDQSGNITVSPTGDNAITFHVKFNPEAEPVVLGKGESATFRYTTSGQYETPVTLIAYGPGGVNSSLTEFVSLDVRLFIEQATLAQIAGGDGTAASSKRWVWDRTVAGHFGVGPLTNDYPEFFSAGSNELNPCLYDDVLVFSHDGNDNYNFKLEPGDDNLTFVNWTDVNRFFPDATPQQFNDECRDITTQATFDTNFVIIDDADDASILDVGSGFLSYWAVIPGKYEIIELTENRLAVRGLSQPFNGDDPLYWYSVFVPEDQSVIGGNNELVSVFNTLVWSDEFDVAGAPNPANWTYDLGTGENGWGNQEAQSYTNDASNVIVEDDVLKITAKAAGGGATGTVYYYDDFQLADATGNPQQSIENFEGTAPSFTGFGGGESQVIVNPDATGINTSGNVGEFTKAVDAETYAGTFFDVGTPLDLSSNNRISVQSWSPKAGATVRIKLENSADGSQFFEADATTSVTNAWENLVFDFSEAPAFSYDRIVIFFDFGAAGSSGASYTSARIKSEGLQEFTYGRVEVKAKLPTGKGTWPALWMLGGDYATNAWPGAGEIDIMEHVGNQQDVIYGTTHDSNNFGGNARSGSTIVSGVSDAFNVYEMEWTETEIKFAVNGEVYFTVTNDPTLPYNKDFFFIMNVAMGGTFGGDIDPAFVESTMEVDYIRMYQ